MKIGQATITERPPLPPAVSANVRGKSAPAAPTSGNIPMGGAASGPAPQKPCCIGGRK
jgi:hypothetical protein